MRLPAQSAGPRPRRAVSRIASAEVLEERLALSVFTVTNTNDVGAGSLRKAISDANGLAGADTIVFDATVFSTPREIVVGDALPQIGGAGLSIVGPGSSLLTVRMGASGLGFRRVFDSYADRLDLSGMTLTGGNVSAGGGAVSINGLRPDAVLDDMVLTGNTSNAANDGGGISLTNNSTLTLRNSTITNNRGRFGGGIFFFLGGSLVMDNCTVANNRALAMDGHNASGGGIFFYGAASTSPPAGYTPGTLLVRNSTISGNQGPGSGGGILLDSFTGTLLVQNSTVSGNTAGVSGGGIAQLAGTGTITLQDSTVTANSAGGTATGTLSTGGGGIARWDHTAATINIDNSIVSGNTNSRAPDILAEPLTTTNVHYSAVGNSTGFTMSATSGNNLAFNTSLMLGPLANNGGRTLTHALLAGSPLIDAGNNALIPTVLVNDQRGAGFARIAGPAVDIGAYERAVPAQEVTRLFFRAPGWAGEFYTYIQREGLGDASFGYGLVAADDQLATLPWIAINRISLRFTRTPTTSLDSLSLRGVNTGNYPAIAYQYDPGTLTATWTLAQPLRNDKLLLELNGGEFRFRFNALPGDTNRSGSVLADDFSSVKKRFFKNTTSPMTGADTDYSVFHDVDGSGSILANDFSEVKKRFFNSLPGPEPTGVAPVGPSGLGKSPFYAGAARVSEAILA
jgi:parallel beta helix pectate lyase-like protein